MPPSAAESLGRDSQPSAQPFGAFGPAHPHFIFRSAQFVHAHALWLAVPMAVLLLVPTPWMGVGALLLLGLMICGWIATGRLTPASPANMPIVVLLAMTALGLAISPLLASGIVTASRLGASVMVFWVLLENNRSAGILQQRAVMLTLLGVVLAVGTPLVVRWAPGKLFELPVVYHQTWGPLPKVVNSNELAGAIAPVVPIALALVAQARRRLRAVGAVTLVPMVAMVVLLQSRGALLALGAGLVVFAVLTRRSLLVLGLIVLIGVGAWDAWAGRPSGLVALFHQVTSIKTFVAREQIWLQAVHLVRQSPLAGIGVGAYPLLSPTAFPYSEASPGPFRPNAHNLYLQLALDTGLGGLAAFMGLVLFALRSAWQAYRSNFERPLAIGVLAAFAVLLVHGVAEVVMWGTAESVLIWILFSLALGLRRRPGPVSIRTAGP